MKHKLFALIAMFMIATAALAQTPSATQSKPEHLTKQQLNTLIASAKTPAEHERLAQYYRAHASDYLAEAKDHESMVAAYKANSSLSNEKNRASTIGHCEYFVKTFKELAVKSQELATLHSQMAKDVEQK